MDDTDEEQEDDGAAMEAVPLHEESYQGAPVDGFNNSRGANLAYFNSSTALPASAPKDFSFFSQSHLPVATSSTPPISGDEADDREEDQSPEAVQSRGFKRGRTDGMMIDSTSVEWFGPPKPPMRPFEVPFGVVAGEDRGPEAMNPPVYRTDPFYWLRDEEHSDKEVQALLREEDSYCERSLRHLQPLREKLYSEMMAHHKEDDVDVPVAYKDGYAYYSRSFKGKSYGAHYRARVAAGTKRLDTQGFGTATSSTAVPADVRTVAAVAGFELHNEELLLNENELRESGASADENPSFLSVHGPELSEDQEVLAYAVDFKGNDNYSIYFRLLAQVPRADGTQELRQSLIPGEELLHADGSILWDATGHMGLYYVQLDREFRAYRVMHHRLGRPQAEDVVILEELDKRFSVSVSKFRDGTFLCISTSSSETSEHHLLDAHNPSSGLACVQPRTFSLRYSIDHQRGQLYILTNKDGAKNEKLCRCALTSLGSAENWVDVWRPNPQVQLESHSCFADFMVVEAREGGVQRMYILDYRADGHPDEPPRHVVTYPETMIHDGTLLTPRTRMAAVSLFSIGLGDVRMCDVQTLRLWYSSYVVPSRVYSYHVPTRTFKLLKQDASPCYDPSLYRCERILSHRREVPISLVYRADLHTEGLSGGPYPTLLTGYGAYGACQDPDFDRTLLCLLDRGVVYAVAHVRGGGELGRHWYEQGRYLCVKNRFYDFHAVADTLLALGITEKDRLAAWGESSGGLLVAASVNSRPDLFRAALLEVPFLDAMNTMSDPSIPLTAGEWEEIGNPNELETYHYMLEYSPYDNVRMQSYPAMLLTASLNDSMVGYWEPLKFLTKLRLTKADSRPAYLKVNFHAGHGHSSDKYEYLSERAHHFAYLLEQLGVENRME